MIRDPVDNYRRQAVDTVGERLISVIEQPCVLCEGTLEIWRVYGNQEGTKQERIEKESVEHNCSFIAELVHERYRDNNYPGKA